MKYTTNYSLKKPDGTDVVNIDDFNANADIIDSELAKRALKTEIPTVPVKSVNSKTGAVTISKSDVGLGSVNNWGASTAINSTSTTTYATASAVKQAYDKAVAAESALTSGKSKIAAAITGKGISTSSTASFDTMATNIKNIKTGSVYVNGIKTNNPSFKYDSLTWSDKFSKNGSTYENIWTVYNNVIYSARAKNLYYFCGEWMELTDIPYSVGYSSMIWYKDELHLLGNNESSSSTYHYKWNPDSSTWTSVSTIPFSFTLGDVVLYNNDIHIFYGSKHYKWNGSSWTSVSTIPFSFYYSNLQLLNNEIHLIGTYENIYRTKHYKWNGSSWTSVSTLPYEFYKGMSFIYNNEIHIMGGESNSNDFQKHYKWNGSSWVKDFALPLPFTIGKCAYIDGMLYVYTSYTGNIYENIYIFFRWDGSKWYLMNTHSSSVHSMAYGAASIMYKDQLYVMGHKNETDNYATALSVWYTNCKVSTLPFSFCKGLVTVYNNEMHVLCGSDVKDWYKHYKWNGSTWTQLNNLPELSRFYPTGGGCLTFNNEIYILSNKFFLKWNGSSWTQLTDIPSSYYLSACTIYNNEIHMLAGFTGYSDSDSYINHYKWNGSSWTRVSTIPFKAEYACSFVYENELHLISKKNHYKWNGSSWKQVCTLSYSVKNHFGAILHDNRVFLSDTDDSEYGFIIKSKKIYTLA